MVSQFEKNLETLCNNNLFYNAKANNGGKFIFLPLDFVFTVIQVSF